MRLESLDTRVIGMGFGRNVDVAEPSELRRLPQRSFNEVATGVLKKEYLQNTSTKNLDISHSITLHLQLSSRIYSGRGTVYLQKNKAV